MAKERELQHALNLAKKIRSQSAGGEEDPITHCPECGKDTFVLQGMSDDGVMEIGYCLHCGYKRDYDRAQEDALDAYIERQPD